MVNKEKLSKMLHSFICEMENTLKDKNKRNRDYAPQVFWKNKYTLEIIEDELKNYEIDCKDFKLEEALVNLERHSKRYKGRKDDLDTLFNIVKSYQYQKKNIESLMKENKTLSKEHKALEIIKKYLKTPISRLVNYENAKAKGYDIGTLEVNDIPYTQEEYELLKEVLWRC